MEITFWRRVRFTDECHFSLGPQGKVTILRQKGERYKHKCMQMVKKKTKHDHKQFPTIHAWGSMGIGHRHLEFYTTSSPNGKMTKEVYLKQILKGTVKKWKERGEDFILEEDRDSGHGTSKKRRKDGQFICEVARWKEQNGVESFFNAPASPDLSPIENAWGYEKREIRQQDRLQYDHFKAEILQIWVDIPEQLVENLILGRRDGMKARIEEMFAHDGRMTRF
jgi:hypothetical protein